MSDALAKLVIYHTADIHAALGFGSRLATLTEPDSVLVDCGDSLAGSSTLYRSHEPVLAELARAPYRAQAVGNREFHYLHKFFLRRARALGIPLVCSNLIDLRERPAAFTRELQLEVKGLRVRILALLVPQYRTGSGWEKVFGWRFLSPEAALHDMLSKNGAGYDATILLSHLGLAADRALAARWPAFAAIIGGHSHDVLAQPEVVNGVPIVHAGAHAQYVGRLELKLSAGRASSFSYALLPLLASPA